MKNSVLLFIKVPPPITGATMCNQSVLDSKIIRKHFNVRHVSVSYNKSIESLGAKNITKYFLFVKYFFMLFKELLINRPRIVYFQISISGFTFYRDLIFVSLIKLFGVKILFHLHGKGIYDISKKEEKYYRYAFNNECVICLANSLCNDISKIYNGVPYVLNNGVEDNLKIEKEVICKSNDGKIRVLFLSNFLISKGIYDMLHIAKNISKMRSNVEFVMIGQYTKEVTEEHLRQKIKEAELSEFINLIGPLFTKEKFDIIKKCDIFLFPTHNEAFSLVLLETMQYYIPSIASIEGGIPDIVEDGVTGFLCEKKNISDFIEKLDKLISDDILRVQMGRNARTRFEQRFTIDKFEQNLLTIIDEVVSKAK